MDAALAPLCSRGIRVLNYIDNWLIRAQSPQLAIQHRDVILAHMKELGLMLNVKKSVLSPAQRTTFLGVVWDSLSMSARLSPVCINAILSAVKGIKICQSLTVKHFQRVLGLMAAASSVIPLGLLYMRPLQWWLKTRAFSPEGQPLPHYQGHKAMPMHLGYVEESLVSVLRPCIGSSLSSRNAVNRCFPYRLGSGPEGLLLTGCGADVSYPGT